MSRPSAFEQLAPLSELALLRHLVQGTAGVTGEQFFKSLIAHLASALGTVGAWVATYHPKQQQLSALAFVLNGKWIEGYTYAAAGTPCETALEQRRCVHIPERVVELYPNDPDLRPQAAVSYLGVPLLDAAGNIIGQLAVMDNKPMPVDADAVAVFRIFASRAAAELERMNAERAVRQREAQLTGLFDNAMDAIVNLDDQFRIEMMNPAARVAFGHSPTLGQSDFLRFLTADSRQRLRMCAEQLRPGGMTQSSLWVPRGLSAVAADGRQFEAEATLSRYELDDRSWLTLILRNVQDRLEAERTIRSLSDEAQYLREELSERCNLDGIIGSSPVLLSALEEVERVAKTDATVLLLGETGTGKELFARSIHASSSRNAKPLIRVNCGALPSTLIESELFGHERGAFTGATARRDGRFSLADGGTLFLDEIGELPFELQAKLLRVLQEGEFEPLGSSETKKVNVRVIGATHRDLLKLVAAGQFREDLYYRLHVFPIRVPALRERASDIPVLAQEFANKFARRMGRALWPLSEEVRKRLQTYPWPGNVRELQNVMERGVIVSESGFFDIARALPGQEALATTPAAPSVNQKIYSMPELAQLERQNIVRALEATGWKVTGPQGAAELLKMNPSTLNSRMRALNVRRPSARS